VADGRGCTLVTSEAAPADAIVGWEMAGARVLRYAYGDGLAGALRAIADDGVNDMLIESGPSLFSALWRERLIDELVFVTAGGMSGNAAPPLFLGQADSVGSDLAPVFYAVEAGLADGDAVTVWRPRS
jgi:riboflavin biosynthesis pyrimidine reductase